MSVAFSDPRNSPALVYLNTNASGNYTYPNPDNRLQIIQQAFSVLLEDMNSFNNSTNVIDLDHYAQNILADFEGIITLITPCANNPSITKCGPPIISDCLYVAEIQLAYVLFYTTLSSLTQAARNQYDFLSFYANNYLTSAIINIPSNLQFGSVNLDSTDCPQGKYSLCPMGQQYYCFTTNSPSLTAKYEALLARETSKAVIVQQSNTSFNLLFVALALLIVIVIICIIKNMIFSNSTTSSKVIKKIGGMLRPGPPSYVRLV